MKKTFLIAFICILIDQIIKIVLTTNLDIGSSLNIINNFFAITLLENTGAAFSIFTQNTALLIIIGVIALVLIYFWLLKGKTLKTHDSILYGMLLGGIMGNLIDRIIHGYVIDYLDFKIFGYNFPVFNFADTLIVISIIIIIVLMFKGDKNENRSKRSGGTLR